MDLASLLHNIQPKEDPISVLIKKILHGVSWFYQTAVSLRNWAFDKDYIKIHTVAAPVISIGNITSGGTGKTPATIFLVKYLQQNSYYQPVILSRGYGQDEQRLYQQILSDVLHQVNSNRYQGACQALAACPEQKLLFVMDDGMQHRKLARDLDIVLIDATCPFGYGYLLPRGFLREPLRQLKRADVFMITRSNLVAVDKLQEIKNQLSKWAPGATHAEAIHQAEQFRCLKTGETVALEEFHGKKAFLFCGIGNPQSFVSLAREVGLEVEEIFVLQDHQAYDQKLCQKIAQRIRDSQSEVILTTSKDGVKLDYWQQHNIFPGDIWILDITLQITAGNKEFLQRVEEKLKE